MTIDTSLSKKCFASLNTLNLPTRRTTKIECPTPTDDCWYSKTKNDLKW